MTRRFVFAGRVCLSLLTVAALASSLALNALPSPNAADSAGKHDAAVSNSPVFLVAPSISVAGRPAAMVVGDLNGDGAPDLVVANAQTGNVDVLLGDGKGKFQAPVHYKIGASPVALVLADLAGHGKIDIAVANQSGNSVSVLLGKGDGTFQTAATYTVSSGPSALAVGDFDGDGHSDLLIANGGSNTLAVLTNKGDGTFQSAKFYALAASPRAIAIADFNGDGKLDIASGNADGTVSILLGDGAGHFNIAATMTSATRVSALVVGDFNRDGKSDLAVADSVASTVSVFLGRGDGTFQSTSVLSVGNEPVSLALEDVNADGMLDLLAVNKSGNTVSVMLGAGDGTFQPSAEYVVGNSPVAVAIADFNGDGHLDLATANSADGTVTVPLGNGDGTFQAAQDYRTHLERKSVAVGDLDGDGHPDVVVGSFCGSDLKCGGNGTASVFLSNGKGALKPASIYALGKGPISIALADVNGDKKLDLIAVNRDDGTVMVLLGNGDGTFQEGIAYPAGSTPVSVSVGDFNKDGKPDLAIAALCGSEGCNQRGSVNVLRGNGDGSFKSGSSYDVGFSPAAVSVGDVDGDGNLDLVVANSCGKSAACSNGTASVLIGDGKGSFALKAEVDLGKRVSSVALADLNGDGKLDLIAASGADNQVGILLGSGDGTFSHQVPYGVGVGPSAVVVADFDGDGRIDVAVANGKSSTVSLLHGNGDGTLQRADTYAVGMGPDALAMLDLDGSGRLALVSANGNSGGSPVGNDITVLANAGAGPQASPVLAITKSHAGNFSKGEIGATYSIVVKNNGTVPTDGTTVTVTDTLPPSGLTATAISGTKWTCVLSTLTCTRSDALSAGASYDTITLTVNVAASAPASVTNKVKVSGGGSASANGSDTTTIGPAIPILAITKTHTDPFTQGQTGATYSITVTNNGGAPTDGTTVTVADTLPSGLTATAISGTNWTCAALPALSCTRKDVLGSGKSYDVITLTVNVAANAPATVTNSATVSGGGSANATVNDLTHITPAPVLAITKTHTDPFKQGQTGATYAITVTNNGGAPTDGTTITVTDTLPPSGLTATAISGTNWTCAALPALSCTRKDALGSGKSYEVITLTVNVAANAPGSVNNCATVTGGGSGPATKCDLTNITPAPVLAINKTHIGTFTQGDVGDKYSITVTNNGGAPTDGTTVTVTDTLPPSGLTATAISGTNWTCAALPALSCARKDALASGKSYDVITLTVNVAANAPASVKNCATVNGGGSGPATGCDITPITPAPVLSITKTHTGSFTQGQEGLWTITVGNTATGSQTSGTLTVTDVLPLSPTTGYTVDTAKSSDAHWTCTGTTTATCTSTDKVSGGSSYSPLSLWVNVPADSPVSVTNCATASGAGSLQPVTTNPCDKVTVIQVPKTVTPQPGSTPQAAVINNVFAVPLAVQVLDAGNQPIPNYTVAFNVPTAGASCSPNPARPVTDSNGIATTVCTANATYGAYTFNATTANGINSNPSFVLTNQDFTLVDSPSAGVVIQGGNLNPATTLTLTPLPVAPPNNNYSGTIALSCSKILPATATIACAFTPSTIAFAPGDGAKTATLAISAAANAPVGSYTITITAQDSSTVQDSHSVTFGLSVECMMAFTGPIATPGNVAHYGFDVTETAGGTACPWNIATPIPGITNLSPSSGTNTGVGATVPPSIAVTYDVGAAAASVNQATIQLSYAVSQSSSLTVTQEAIDNETQNIIAGGSLTTMPLPVPSGDTMQFVALAGSNYCNVADAVVGDPIDSDGSRYGVTCSQPVQTANGVEITISTTAGKTATLEPRPNPGSGFDLRALFCAFSVLVPGIVLFGAGAWRRLQPGKNRREYPALIVAVLMIALLVLLPACGGGFPGKVNPPGNPGNYTVTVMGTVMNGSVVVGVEIYTVSINVTPQS